MDMKTLPPNTDTLRLIGLPVYPQAKIVSVNEVRQHIGPANVDTLIAMISTNDDETAVENFYMKKFPNAQRSTMPVSHAVRIMVSPPQSPEQKIVNVMPARAGVGVVIQLMHTRVILPSPAPSPTSS